MITFTSTINIIGQTVRSKGKEKIVPRRVINVPSIISREYRELFEKYRNKKVELELEFVKEKQVKKVRAKVRKTDGYYRLYIYGLYLLKEPTLVNVKIFFQ